MDPVWCRALRRLVAAAESLQVQLYGRYSTDRVRKLAVYHQATSPRRAVVILIATAIPCLIAPILLDAAHLPEPYDGLGDNKFFFVRLGIAWWAFGFLAAHQGGHFVSSISLTIRELAVAATVASAGTTGITYAIATAVGFPVPFTIVLGAPFWVTQMCTWIALMWMRRLRTTPEARPQIISWMKVWTCQCCLVAIYLGYFYIFTSLPSSYQLPFACLLPIIKVLVRNWLSRALEHLKDEMSEHVLLNADIFSALFIAYCMQNTPSTWTIVGLMSIDAVQILVAMRDVHRYVDRIETLQAQIEAAANTPSARKSSVSAREPAASRPPESQAGPSRLDLSAMRNVLAQADAIITRHPGASSVLVRKKTFRTTYESSRGVIFGTTTNANSVREKVVENPVSLARHVLCKVVPGGAIGPPDGQKDANPLPTCATGSTVATTLMALPPLERRFVETVGRLLFFTEFLLLLNYVEVVIPIVYCAYPSSRSVFVADLSTPL